MKVSIIAFSLLTSIVSGLAVPDVVTREVGLIKPTLAVNIKESSPNTPFGPAAVGEVHRSNGQNNVQTLLSFDLPALPGKACTIYFTDPTNVSGTKIIQVFDVVGPITASNTFNTRPYRNNYRCVLAIKDAGQGPATIRDNVSCVFPCPAVATTLGLEAVPSGDSVSLTWDINTAGLVIAVNKFSA